MLYIHQNREPQDCQQSLKDTGSFLISNSYVCGTYFASALYFFYVTVTVLLTNDRFQGADHINKTWKFLLERETIQYLLPMCWRVLRCSRQHKCFIRICTLFLLATIHWMTVRWTNDYRWYVVIGRRYCRGAEFNIKPKSKPMQWCWKKVKILEM